MYLTLSLPAKLSNFRLNFSASFVNNWVEEVFPNLLCDVFYVCICLNRDRYILKKPGDKEILTI